MEMFKKKKKKKDKGDFVCVSLLVNECNNPELIVFNNDIAGKGMYSDLSLIELMFSHFHFVPR